MAAVVKLNPGAIEAVLKSEPVASMVHDKAVEVAAATSDNCSAAGHPEIASAVQVEDYVTDRAASAVVVLHAGAHGMQAKYGILTRAAGDAGLELRASSA